MLRVWGRRSAFNVQKVLWLIGELGLAHEHVDAGGAFAGLDSPAFLAMNPHGRVPVIDDEGLIVWESHAIIRYLAARHGAGSLWPRDLAARSPGLLGPPAPVVTSWPLRPRDGRRPGGAR